MSIRDDIVATAKEWVGTPYKHAGRNEFGMDCVGLVIKVAHGCSLSDHDTLNYPRRPVVKDFLREMRDHLTLVPKSGVKQGTILVFREPKHPCHIGILEIDAKGQRYVIHAFALARKVIREPMTKERWDRCAMAFDYNGVEG